MVTTPHTQVIPEEAAKPRGQPVPRRKKTFLPAWEAAEFEKVHDKVEGK